MLEGVEQVIKPMKAIEQKPIKHKNALRILCRWSAFGVAGLAMPALWAEAPANPQQVSMWGNIFLLLAFLVVFYFLIWRPQSKRAKEHKSLLAGLQKGSEIVTTGGILGRITKLSDDFVLIEVSEKVELPIQKISVAAELPKGTLKALKS